MAESAAPIPGDLLQLDLSILGYQLYQQSLIWPLDPFYEEWARPGASRRDNLMAEVHRFVAKRSDLRGPGSTRGWPTNDSLDPIICDYRFVNPWNGVITNDGTHHRYVSAHSTLTDAIADVTVCEYLGIEDGIPITPTFTTTIPNPAPSTVTTDHLYVFEGATGSFDGHPPAWSLMGLVLERRLPDGGYEVHISHRGSQSGNGNRAAFQGFVLERGNPDWVTDMEFVKTVRDERLSPEGTVVRGLRDSAVTMLGSLIHCLVDIAQRNDEPPRSVHFTGHSLGGALATQVNAAFAVGGVGETLPTELQGWPWAASHLTTFGAPKAGDEQFAAHFDAEGRARRVWAQGDPLVEFPLYAHVGQAVPLRTTVAGTENHEPAVIRRALVSQLRWDHVDGLDASMSHQPWSQHPSLGDALAAAAQNGDDPAALFPGASVDSFEALAEIAAAVVAKPSSYRLGLTKPPAERRRRSRQVRSVLGLRATSPAQAGQHLRRFRGVQPASGVEDHLRRVFLIGEAVRNNWPAADLLDDPAIAKALGTYRRPRPSEQEHARTVAQASGPPPSAADIARVRWILKMREVHKATVPDSTESTFRRRVPPVSGMPNLVPACSYYDGLEWLPKELMVPDTLPPEAQMLPAYKAKYYGLGKLGFAAYQRSPIRPEVPWDPNFEWNTAFPPTGDGWEHPTSDETFVRLRTEGPNPFVLRRTADGFEADFSSILDGVFPATCARFDLVDGALVPREITVGAFTHRPGDATWNRAKRVVNAADIRCIPFTRHLLDVHFIVGAAFASAAFSLPTWHPLRPFMHFFSYGTLQVNDYAYQAFFVPSSYFVGSGFINGEAARAMFHNRIATFDLDEWVPPKDITARGLEVIDGHPYVADALSAWTEFEGIVDRYLTVLDLDDDAIAADNHLQAWYLTLASLIPNLDPRRVPLNRERLVELCSAFLYNNVVHEICGDLTPILGSLDPDDKAIINLEGFLAAVGDGELTTPLPAPSMADVFLMDQASYASQFNVGGNNLLNITAARWVDDPKLSDAVEDLQRSLRSLETELVERNAKRAVRFGRMLPTHWEASVSF